VKVTRRSLIPILLLVSAAVGGTLLLIESARPLQVTLVFHPVVGDKPLLFDKVYYANPGGDGLFKIRDFQFFLSNIRLIADSGDYAQPESYRLARFDIDDGNYRVVLDNVPRLNYQRIEFGIGVDPEANGSINLSGDLDPNSRMAWSWDVGYKFVLFEGGLEFQNTQYPLVYHVGFDENYKLVSFPLGERVARRNQLGLDFQVDILRLFVGANTVDMTSLPNVKFDRVDARLLADNYAAMVTLCPASCGR